MATIYFKLSKRVDKVTNLTEIILRVRSNNHYDILAKSGLFLDPINFKLETNGQGKIVVNRRKVGNNVKEAENTEKKLNELCTLIHSNILGIPKEDITKEWVSNLIEKFHHPEKEEMKKVKDIHTLFDEYIEKNTFSKGHLLTIKVLSRAIGRYEYFRQKAEKEKGFLFAVDKVTSDDIEGFFDYFRNESALCQEYPKTFEKIAKLYPEQQCKFTDRGDNYIVKMRKRLKAFFNWLNTSLITTNQPFKGLTVGSERYGTPYYITIEERNLIESFPFENEHLQTQRDIFIFQCLIGCRISDLVKLTENNITNGILTYTPHKTKNEGETPILARVPLHKKAVALIEKYKGIDKEGRLFPFISSQKYNEAIKEIFTFCNIKRMVSVRNSQTGEEEMKPLNEIASSHLARRTFVGNAYKMVSDPNIIGKMSGHVEGSRAFVRYRNIEDETLKNVINQL